MHPDHIGGLLAGGAPAFPNATVHVSETDLAFWTDEAHRRARRPTDCKPFFAARPRHRRRLRRPPAPFNGDVEVLPGITAVGLPGHTVGHTGFRLASGDAEILVFGDAAHFAAVQFTHPEAGLVFDTDPTQAAATRAQAVRHARDRPDRSSPAPTCPSPASATSPAPATPTPGCRRTGSTM